MWDVTRCCSRPAAKSGAASLSYHTVSRDLSHEVILARMDGCWNHMSGGKRAGAGRKPVAIDLVELEKLCTLQCTNEEISAWFNCSIRTIETYAKKPEFAEVMARGRAKGRISVRRTQMKLMESGSAAVAIWLGKQLLGQRDVTPVELTGANGKPMQITLEVIDAILAQDKKS
jgi:hypothetical protein